MKNTHTPRRKAVGAIACTLVVLCGTLLIVLVNPFNWGVQRSEHFTQEKFDSIRMGESIGEVTKDLGRPIGVTNRVGFPGICREGECAIYTFTGKASRWVLSYKEAWVVVNQQGRVVHTVMYNEP
jgi:hypothetical protein